MGKTFCVHCSGYNFSKLEEGEFGCLGQFRYPELVKEHMPAAGRKDVKGGETESDEVTRTLDNRSGRSRSGLTS